MVIKVKYNGEWVKIPYLSDVHGEELVTEAPKDDKQYARQNGVWTVVNIPEVDFTDIYTALDTKVDKVEGKGLSTEDYLTLDKTKVNNLNEVLENAVLNTTATGSTITLDKRNLVTGTLDNVELSIPVSTTDLAGLMLPADKIKLNGIAANAEVNVNADWNATEGDAQILNKPTLATVATSGSYNDLNDQPTFNINLLLKEGEKYNTPTDITQFVNQTYGSIENLRENILLYKQLYRSHVSNNVEVIAAYPNLYHLIAKYGSASSHYIYIHYDLQANDDNTSITIYKVGSKEDFVDGDGTKALTDDGTYKSVAAAPDYTVFDIVSELVQMDVPSISQENYNYLISVIQEDGIPNNFAIRPLSLGICSLIGAKSSGVISLVLDLFKHTDTLLNGYVITIDSDLSINIKVNSVTYSFDNSTLTFGSFVAEGESMTQNSITFQTKGDKSESLMADGKYRKLPVYGRNLLLGSGKEVSSSNYPTASYWLTESIQKNAEVTCTIWGDLGEGLDHFMLFNSGDRGDQLVRYTPEDFVNGKASKTFKWRTQTTDGDETSNTFLRVYAFPRSSTTSTIHKIKLEYGDISTEWSPAWEDIPDLEERYAYGVEWDTASSSPDGVRVGNIQLHRELPIQSKMRRCLLDRDGGVKEYLDDEFSWGGSYLYYAVMTEIPEHWYKLYFNGTKFRMMLSEIPLPGYKHVDKFYISTYEARMYRTDNLLCSAAGASKLSDPNSINFRGGDNTAEWDDTYRSLLGCPVTNLTRDQFRQAARKRGSGWEMYTYGAHKTLFWLFAVEYATLNSQKPFNAQKDANGFSQGGLGNGPTQMTDWTNFNNNNPLIQCGYTNEFGNGSGEKAYVVKNASDGTHATLMANRYRGIENPFGHIWKYTDGANIQVTTGDSGLSILWTTDDPSNFSDISYTGYDKKGNICRTNGYAKKMLLGEDGDIVATEIGGSSSTYWCDYYNTYTQVSKLQVLLIGGRMDGNLGAGLVGMNAGNAPLVIGKDLGTRLCFFPKYKSTQITA